MSQREISGVEVTDRPARNARLTFVAVAVAGFAVGGVAWLLAAWVGEWNVTYFVIGCANVALAGAFATRAASRPARAGG